MPPAAVVHRLLPLLLLAGCAALDGARPPGAVVCEDPRPQVCTMDYTPVCAIRDGGERATYANACGACADQRVNYHLPGACDG